MAFTLVAFNAPRADAVAALTPLAAVPDQHVRVVGNDIIVPDLRFLLGAYSVHGTVAVAGGVTLAQLSSPELRKTILKDLSRAHDTITVLDSENIEIWPDTPIPLLKDEALNALMANIALAAARGMIAVLLCDGPIVPVKAPEYTVLCTTVLAPVANAWSNAALVFTQALPKGTYQVVGARVVSAAACGVFRFVFVGAIGGQSWRPGGPITTNIMLPDIPVFRHGGLGVWGTFEHNVPPTVEVCTISAVANPNVYLDLVKVA